MKQDLGRNSEILWPVYSTGPEQWTSALGSSSETCIYEKERQYWQLTSHLLWKKVKEHSKATAFDKLITHLGAGVYKTRRNQEIMII